MLKLQNFYLGALIRQHCHPQELTIYRIARVPLEKPKYNDGIGNNEHFVQGAPKNWTFPLEPGDKGHKFEVMVYIGGDYNAYRKTC